MRFYLLLFGIGLCFMPAAAQDEEGKSCKPASSLVKVRVELETMLETDQAHRMKCMEVEKEFGRDSKELKELWEKQLEIDKRNIASLEAIITQHGWPGKSHVGDKAALAAFLVLQHADYTYQKKYLPMVREAVKAKECDPPNLALLEDRVLMREGKAQIYGSQVVKNAKTGAYEVYRIKDEADVDERRAAVGLPPLKEYLTLFGIVYLGPENNQEKSGDNTRKKDKESIPQEPRSQGDEKNGGISN